jgi:hypothetical protein
LAQHSLEVLEEWEVIGVRVARRLHHQRDPMLGGFAERDHACSVNQIPESRCIEVDHGTREVHRSVVVEETSIGESNDFLTNRAFSGGRRAMEEQQLHRPPVSS